MIAALAGVVAYRAVTVPFEKGAHARGMAQAPRLLLSHLPVEPTAVHHVDGDQDTAPLLRAVYGAVQRALEDGEVVVTLGGDHSVSAGSVLASHHHCDARGRRLGVLWCDAHADFHTLETSSSKKLHGMPVAILCGHTSPSLLVAGPDMSPCQFAYFGMRCADDLECERIAEHDMRILRSEAHVYAWVSDLDCVHLSFDADCLDAASYPRRDACGGISLATAERVFRGVEEKLIAVDVAEFNPGACEAPRRVAESLARLVCAIVV